ncbi:MAG: cob(I)yrinic acid a,c-diamide adenosyltransferase [Calditrichaceae bacterium]
MKIYTGFGDEGDTALFGGQTVKKNNIRVEVYGALNIRVEVYGALDELNSYIGMLRIKNTDPGVDNILAEIQDELFVVSSEIATPDEKNRKKLKNIIDFEVVRKKEKHIDKLSEQLDPLKNFILPGGCEAAAFAHIARTVCRRAERNLVPLILENGVRKEIIVYLNRLSDLLFVLARYLNKLAGTDDVLWKS